MRRSLTLAQFAAETSGTTTADVDGHIHAGLRSKPRTKTFAKFYATQLTALQNKRDATLSAYREAIARGEIAAPQGSTLAEIAAGEGSCAEAARRVIAKRAARLARAA